MLLKCEIESVMLESKFSGCRTHFRLCKIFSGSNAGGPAPSSPPSPSSDSPSPKPYFKNGKASKVSRLTGPSTCRFGHLSEEANGSSRYRIVCHVLPCVRQVVVRNFEVDDDFHLAQGSETYRRQI